MKRDIFDFCKNIITEEALNQYNLLKNYEDMLKTNPINKNYLRILLIQNMLNVLNIIYIEKNELNRNQYILLYNNLIYKLRLLLKITNKDDKLEDSFLTQNETNNIEKICLKRIEKLIKKSIYKNNLNNNSIIFLYLLTLISLKIDIDNYCRQNLTINDGNCSYFNVSFYDEINIKDKKENINKIKKLILNLDENSQE